MSRQSTEKVLDSVEQGMLDANYVLLCCLKYMSESDVEDMAHCNGFFDDEVE